jgi:hypothetical protein
MLKFDCANRARTIGVLYKVVLVEMSEVEIVGM